MRRLKLAFIVIFIGISFLSQAQSPGYMGKKAALSIGASVSPLMGWLFSEEEIYDLNLKFNLRFEYVVARRIALGIQYERINDIIYLKNYGVTGSNPLIDLSPNGSSQSPAEFKSAANFYGNSYSGFVKFYNKGFGSIAPVGRYFILEAQYSSVIVSDDGRYYNGNPTELHRLNTMTVLLGVGIENVYFDHLTVDLSLNMGLNGAGIRGIQNEKDYFEAGGNNMTRQIESKMFSDYIMLMRANVGWLIF